MCCILSVGPLLVPRTLKHKSKSKQHMQQHMVGYTVQVSHCAHSPFAQKVRKWVLSAFRSLDIADCEYHEAPD